MNLKHAYPVGVAIIFIWIGVSSYSGNWASFDVRGGWYLYNDSKVFWDEARASCLSLGADLISIHSQAENDFVYENITRNRIAIVATDAAEEGTFLWTDGSPMDYTRWHSGEPNNARGVEDCVFMQPSDEEEGWNVQPSDKGMGWNDGPCNSSITAAFICYKEENSICHTGVYDKYCITTVCNDDTIPYEGNSCNFVAKLRYTGETKPFDVSLAGLLGVIGCARAFNML